ncbi:hypothetical protein [Tengunoibacter tsumagoiensis]|uniref:Uncharacterized protein n=1 Tax=Tengunoibacter tsumagoiensis TaxID=2014871 RepID=A0A402A4B0_9CHLR|nr:hypothetical protein [Tengunoibacter tsumagoiensis]GCE13909.1 hypothetical protein KTT_37680 [Tengunoibacter tsumagoiensis]
MVLHVGERVYWGTPEVIYLEGPIVALHAEFQTVVVHIERATTYSAHLIGTEIPFAADGVMPLKSASPPNTTSERNTDRQPLPAMSDDEKVQRAAAAAVHQQYGYQLSKEHEQALIAEVARTLNNDSALRSQIITSMDEILRREW